MTRVIVHAGFHKTGTSSLQAYLGQHRKALAPYLAFYGKADFINAGSYARLYAQRPFFWRRWAFRRAIRAFLNAVPAAPVIVLSRETFAGVMPGHRNWLRRTIRGYAFSAVPICRELRREILRRFPGATVEFLFTTREREDWIHSVYGHLLRSIHLTETFDAFRARFPDLIDPAVEAQRIAAALAPSRTHIAALEDYADGHAGPGDIVLDLVGVPANVRAALPRAGRANIGQTAAQKTAFLNLNHSGQGKTALKHIKDTMLREAREK
ncbi:hypothetical protein [Phaeovulum sp.]|uniref:hypothetical protein n=1 Tax=Phaeovulum sp. TaxID=2934796 RepID=UPI0039E5AA85